MPLLDAFRKISKAPTNPIQNAPSAKFDVADLYRGPIDAAHDDGAASLPLDEKLRQAYFWIVNSAIISPHYDVEFNDAPPQSVTLGDSKTTVVLPSAQSYSSFVLLPLLTFATRRKCLFIGGPGRGKTASALLMGVLAGYPVRDVRRAMQHGQPQMTVSDLLGNPLPADLITAQKADDIRIAWRKWLGMRVKIIDEYNRIPTRTQSALLTLMSDNYAEVLDQIYECPESAWFLTANDEAGGGTYAVIEALRDRIDVVVTALAFNTRFIGDLLQRIEEGVRPEDVVPSQIVFSEPEIDQMSKEINRLPVPEPVRRRLEFFASQFEFLEPAAEQLEYKTKDTARLAGVELRSVFAQDTGKDRSRDLGLHTLNGLSVRALFTLLAYAKALAWFRGEPAVTLDDVRQVLPFVLHSKLNQNPDAEFLAATQNQMYRSDRIGWLRKLFDLSCAEYERLNLDREDPVRTLLTQISQGLDGLTESDVRTRLNAIERTLAEIGKAKKLYGPMMDDVLALKYMHQRYTNYLRWVVKH